MNRAARRQSQKPIRIPEWRMRHFQRIERGYTPANMAHIIQGNTPEDVVQGHIDQARGAWSCLTEPKPQPIEEQGTAWKYLVQTIYITCERARQIAQANPAEQAQIDMMIITLHLAANGLERMQQRAQTHGSYAPDAIALQAIPEAIDLHEQILRLSTPAQMEKAVHAVRVKQGMAF